MAAGVRDPPLLQALREVPRSAFVPAALAAQAYLDQPLPIPHGQVTTQPSLVAKMLEALELTGFEQVLEVGTGYGFQTALLAYLTRFVWSIERWPDIAGTARDNLAGHGVTNVEAVDPNTVKVTFKAANPYPYQIFTSGLGNIIQKKQFESFLGANAKDARSRTFR